MITQAIIAEYNPFHNGHNYLLEQALAQTNANYTLALMSGNFLQRGTVSMWDKYTRARMCINSGIDLVLELPFPYATGSARDFAAGAVNILNSLNTIDYLCFGAEASDTDILNDIVTLLSKEPEEYSILLKNFLSSGMSYPVARQNAVIQYFNDEKIKEVINGPNNILAIEYMLALKQTHSKIKPVIIKRISSNYHDKELSGGISSATAIRAAIKNNEFDKAATEVPECTRTLIEENNGIISPVLSNALTPFVQARLISKDYSEKICDLSEELAARISKLSPVISYDLLINELKTKNYTETRIRRSILHLLLNYTNEDRAAFINDNYAYYGNILGFKKVGAPFIKQIKNNSSIPIITKKADAKKLFMEWYDGNILQNANTMWNMDINATSLYNCLIYNCFGTIYHNDFTIPLPIA